MERADILSCADGLLETYRAALYVDPFYGIKLELVEGNFASELVRDGKSALSWIVRLNPLEHRDLYDVQYSIVEALVKIICEPLSGDVHSKDGVIARITKAFVDLSSRDDPADTTQNSLEGESEDRETDS
jgi:hypothetical protein